MSRRLSLFWIVPFVVLSFLLIPFTAPVSAQIKVAVCYDPGELLASDPNYFVERIEAGGGIDAQVVTYEEVGLGALSDNTFFTGGFDVAYFWGGGSIIFEGILSANGLGQAVKDFVSAGNGLIAHCGAAAAMSKNLKTLFFIRIPAMGLLPIDASVEINQLLNLLGRALVSLGARFLAPVDVSFVECIGNDCDPMLYDLLGDNDPLRSYVWDGGVSYAGYPGPAVKVHSRVQNYAVHQRFARYNRGKPFFLSSSYPDAGGGKVMFCPGSPELAGDDAIVSEILRAEVFYVTP